MIQEPCTTTLGTHTHTQEPGDHDARLQEPGEQMLYTIMFFQEPGSHDGI